MASLRPWSQWQRTVALVYAVMLAATACGSTAHVDQQRVTNARPGDLTSGALDDEFGPSRAFASELTGDEVSPGGAPRGTGGPGDRRGAATAEDSLGTVPSSPAVDGPGRATGRGFTATQIKVGVPMSREEGAGNRMIGAEEDGSDPRRQMEIVVEEVNRTGGISGREVVPVIFEIDELSAQTIEQQFQAACAYWTEDEPVFAVAVAPAYTFLRDSFRSCLDRQDVPLWIGTTSTNADEEAFSRFSLYVQTSSLHLGRLGHALAEDLVAQEFFRSTGLVEGARVGLVRFDQPSYQRAANEHFKPILGRHGIQVAEEAEITEPQRLSDVGTASAQISNTQLRFNSRGITHVVILEESAFLAWLFMNQAESQGYRPRYGLHSGNIPRYLMENVPTQQLRDAAGIGHSPVDDVADDQPPVAPGRRRCLDVMQGAGVVFSGAGDEKGAQVLCDTFFLLQRAAAGMREPLEPTGLLTGLATVGDSFESAATFRTFFSTRQRDGAAAYRRLAFFGDCTCFRYTSALLRAP